MCWTIYDNVEIVTYESGEFDLSQAFRDKNDRPAPMLKYSKRVDGTYYVVEAIPEAKHKKFWVVSAYMEKAGGGTQVPNAHSPGATPDASLASSPSASANSIPQTAQNVNPAPAQQAEKSGQTGTLLAEAYDLARRMGACGQKGLSEALGIRKLGGDFNETDFLIGYIDVYLAALNGVPHGPAYLPATVDSHARRLSLVERMQAYHNGLNDAKARTQAAQSVNPETGIPQAAAQGQRDRVKFLYSDDLGEKHIQESISASRQESETSEESIARLQETINVDSDIVKGVIPKGAEIENIRIVAGGSSKAPIRVVKYLSETFGGDPLQWIKKGGIIKTDNFLYDVHWFELDGKHYQEKLKGVKRA